MLTGTKVSWRERRYANGNEGMLNRKGISNTDGDDRRLKNVAAVIYASILRIWNQTEQQWCMKVRSGKVHIVQMEFMIRVFHTRFSPTKMKELRLGEKRVLNQRREFDSIEQNLSSCSADRFCWTRRFNPCRKSHLQVMEQIHTFTSIMLF